MNLDRLLQQCEGAANVPPVEQWDPPLAGDMPLVIKADGQWLHEGRAFTRPALVRLLASLLRQDPEGVCLVTPVERWRIEVEDCPFVIVQAHKRGSDWYLVTQYDDELCLSADHPLSITSTPTGESVPQVPVRQGLSARISRNVYYQLVEAATSREQEGGTMEIGIESAGQWHVLGHIDGHELTDSASGAE
jgi:hypothetical protein